MAGGKMKNMISLKEQEVNVGRQRELDLVKGFLMIMIVFIHSFQTIAGAEAAESSVHKIMFALFMPTGACLYLFTMGFGSAFTRHSQPKDMVKNGVKLLFYQGLSNLCYAAIMTICFNIRNSITGEAAGSRELYNANLYSMLTFVNIFFIAGMCYLVLAIYRKLNVKLSGYIISAVIVGIISPFTGLLVSDNPALNWILDMTFGGKGETSFCFFPYLSYVFLGYVFGKVIRRVPENEKGNFYKKSGVVCGTVAVVWFICCIVLHPGIEGFFNYMIGQYRVPGLAKVTGSFCSIILVFAIAFWIMPIMEKWKFGYNKLCYFSKQISKMYAVHIGVYWVIGGFAAFYEFGVKGCLILSVIVLIATDLIVQGYLIVTDKIKSKKG
ncbi:MAG: heparan-alpha-glucosaminide N-acetyltransferase domain-containing protein [Blautia sp.]|uniref:heparan-alpha-glucosaminide N-acetyltransferase domain-containing protein n=1 Tax=Blautia sp. TaxID=1955243 RepID=UPI0025B9D945|nr:heparan-alpha-glucosaminide N-acetyltransferase domain-containing protein [Blautia sp.]MCI6301830.1 heparan-alpha-glucosaminide N-acetyltransferase domain-containing protein [Blautia sp.]MDD6415072.1 heparan-alpha-glucosaminide N-acetyltransferase domain-containing protein [Blautia sp.]MDY4115225.1 heparan-alpha-glucosaminide N-acetyltransferase domain-containing protein [Blautia sp.]